MGRGHPGRCPLKVNWLRAGNRDLIVEDGESTNPILTGRRSGGQKEEGDKAKRETTNLQRRDHQQPPHNMHQSLYSPSRCSRERRREAAGEGETDKPLSHAAASKTPFNQRLRGGSLVSAAFIISLRVRQQINTTTTPPPLVAGGGDNKSCL